MNISETKQVSPFFVFFLIHAMQVGIGILTYQRAVTKFSGEDSWLAVPIATLVVSIIIWMMYQVLNAHNTDITEIHKRLFGKWIGGLLTILFSLYLFLLAVFILRAYIEVIQVWVFQELQTWHISVLAALFFYSVVSGGFRTVTGLCVVGVLLPSVLFFFMLIPLEYAHWVNLTIYIDHSFIEILQGALETTLSYLGVEMLLVFYPFIKRAQESQLWAQIGNASTGFVYLVIMLVSIVFYSKEQLQETIWPTLTMLKIIHLPIIERFEYIGISLWIVAISPNIGLAIWSASRGLKNVFLVKQKYILMFFSICVAFLPPLFVDRREIEQYGEIISDVGMYVMLVYIPFLYVSHLIFQRIKKVKEK
ncbi:GerAB/ArcD/ProY family transporter [Salsuginibacillus kocurii]|uniref:GerAB/ArcD/ProY family transporter n=1 Tax=Salsuginibacillus kocurii TaxID=427078 RepID=UPI00036D7D63|nr:GerAB/ArcD/ProY family transporter [Salsuginibacillus kocurii]